MIKSRAFEVVVVHCNCPGGTISILQHYYYVTKILKDDVDQDPLVDHSEKKNLITSVH